LAQLLAPLLVFACISIMEMILSEETVKGVTAE
jgi:hypothetical protein